MGISIQELFENKECKKQIPTGSGVYTVRIPSGMTVKFKKEPDGFQVTHKRTLSNIYDEVVAKWNTIIESNADASILYYGRGINLRRRIMQYVNFGYKYKSYDNHEGGRAIWYIIDNGKLEFEFYETPDYKSEEARLICEYEAKYGNKPLANAIKGEN